MAKTLEQIGTPLARIYRGGGRFTGELVSEDTPTNDWDETTNYSWVGNMTEEEFFSAWLHQEHVQLHTQHHAVDNCPDCIEMGWVN